MEIIRIFASDHRADQIQAMGALKFEESCIVEHGSLMKEKPCQEDAVKWCCGCCWLVAEWYYYYR